MKLLKNDNIFFGSQRYKKVYTARTYAFKAVNEFMEKNFCNCQYACVCAHMDEHKIVRRYEFASIKSSPIGNSKIIYESFAFVKIQFTTASYVPYFDCEVTIHIDRIHL